MYGVFPHDATYFEPWKIDYVYTLRCPLDFDVFYVGRTVQPDARLIAHIHDHETNEAKRKRIKTILDAGNTPIMRVIDQTEIRTKLDKIHATYKEHYWIHEYLKMGWALTNAALVTTPISSTYWHQYLKTREKGGRLPPDFYCMGDYEGEKVYDRQRLKADGGWVIYETTKECTYDYIYDDFPQVNCGGVE